MSADLYSIATFLVCAISIFSLLYAFGINGLFAYSIVIAIASNIQVLKVAQYSFFSSPVPLGTVTFATMFAVDNIINEHYGAKCARRCILIGFASYLLFSVLMLLADWHPFVSSTDCANMYNEIHSLFSPSFSFFVASLTAYLAGQFLDVHLFTMLKKRWNEKFLSIRSCITMIVSTFVDNAVFSIIAWKLLATIYIPWSDIFYTYICGSSFFRFFIAICCVPLVKLSYVFLRHEKQNV